jgi:hypothetical protein
MLEAAYASFLDEVYLKPAEASQRLRQQAGENDQIWKFLDEIGSKLELFCLRFADPKGFHTSVRDAWYISTIVSFLDSFYGKHFNIETASQYVL